MVTRPRHQAGEMQDLLEERGAAAFLFPTVEIRELEDYSEVDQLLASNLHFDWLVMTSANGVDMLVRRLNALGLQPGSRFVGTHVAAIGSQTSLALQAAGLNVELVPPAYVAESLAHALIEQGMEGKRVLTLRSELAREVLTEILTQAGAVVTDLPIYTSTLPEPGEIEGALQALQQGKIDVVTFTSASAVRNFNACFPFSNPAELLAGVKVACIGPVTAQTAHQLLGRVDLEAPASTVEELVGAIVGTPPRSQA